jgi:hypothetical protein
VLPPRHSPGVPPAARPTFGRRCARAGAFVACLPVLACLASGCDTPSTNVVLDNDYPSSAKVPLVVFQASWQAVAFQGPVFPGASSPSQPTIVASDNTAYVVLGPGWDPDASASPPAPVVLQSRDGFSVHLNETLHIPVDDDTFIGDCAAGHPLTQSQADFITQLVFPGTFANARYDAATCTTTWVGDAGGDR